MSDEDNAEDPIRDQSEIEKIVAQHGLKLPDGKATENYPTRYSDVLKAYAAHKFTAKRLDDKKAKHFVTSLVKGGALVWEYKGRRLNWITGLSAFCRHDGSDVIAEMIEIHNDVCVELYGMAMDQVESVGDFRTHDDTLDPDKAAKRGVYLASDLHVEDRQHLTDAFINQYLRPYLDARRESLSIFFKQIEATHRAGQVLIFRRESDGGHVLVLPRDGFDGLGSYRVPRANYLTGFDYSEEEVDVHLLGGQAPHFNPEVLVFLSSDQIPELCVYDGADGVRQGRPKGINYTEADLPFVKQMYEVLHEGEAISIAEAARLVFDADPGSIKGGGTEASKQKRLARLYNKTYPSG
ncbi:hypothetical protein ACFFUT_08510 [Pseudohalocynthiibacter aestuariivivens]|uniref:DUF4238 domain-containing protein n=1 Tax=Pseudohalocynthiibacter aestuariivivens TaxID=1591409 RepID=A0ABV5JG33_9RHOB|nr:hypothetical protein [Pseudohalocynthiibacter aestuariivivens]MBS9718820.1 hypothetical protein [Pseudohalocynthiibacter aestuariivivens]